jgi:hypothetical protein
MLLDVGNHPGIENARAIVGGITAAIKLEIGSSEVQPDFFGQLFQSMGFASSAGGIVVFQEACQPHWYHEALHLPLLDSATSLWTHVGTWSSTSFFSHD